MNHPAPKQEPELCVCGHKKSDHVGGLCTVFDGRRSGKRRLLCSCMVFTPTPPKQPEASKSTVKTQSLADGLNPTVQPEATLTDPAPNPDWNKPQTIPVPLDKLDLSTKGTPPPQAQDAVELKDQFFDLIDKHFPKGKCKERGAAIVLVAEILISMGSRKPDAIRQSSQDDGLMTQGGKTKDKSTPMTQEQILTELAHAAAHKAQIDYYAVNSPNGIRSGESSDRLADFLESDVERAAVAINRLLTSARLDSAIELLSKMRDQWACWDKRENTRIRDVVNHFNTELAQLQAERNRTQDKV